MEEPLDREIVNKANSNTTQYKLNKYAIEDAEDRIKSAGKVLIGLGLFIVVVYVIINFSVSSTADLIVNGLIAGLYIVGGIFVKKAPVVILSLALSLYLLLMLGTFLIQPAALLSGVVWRVAIISILGIGLFNAVKANKLKKEFQ